MVSGTAWMLVSPICRRTLGGFPCGQFEVFDRSDGPLVRPRSSREGERLRCLPPYNGANHSRDKQGRDGDFSAPDPRGTGVAVLTFKSWIHSPYVSCSWLSRMP